MTKPPHSSEFILLKQYAAKERAIQRWLSLAIALVVMMVVLGGVTRLTESGLSIVEWKLLSGTLPPMSEQAWQTEFDSYKATPQFQKVNSNFTIADFQQIYWLEYLHRLLGRIIGLVIVGGTLYFIARRALPPALTRRMLAVSLLVGAQGTVGWVMVASGLVDQPRVAPIKLALHLILAFSLYGALLWTRWQVLGHEKFPVSSRLILAAKALLALLILQIIFGALVAGLRAGLSYNTYPLMDGQLIPDGLYLLEPWWRNHVDSVLTVQFQHRIGALVVAAATLLFARKLAQHEALRPAAKLLTLAILFQFTLGVATLLSGVNLWLASAHQLLALWLFGIVLRILYRARTTA